MKNGKKIWYYAKHLILFVGLAVCGCGSVHSAMFNKEHFCEYGEWEIIEQPLCEEDGLKERYCGLDSSHAQKEIVPATGHTYEDFYCKDCGAEQVSVGLRYEETEKGLRIVGIGDCKDVELAIPQEIDGKQVVEIGGYAFSNNNIQKVKIPDSVTSIASYAFSWCLNLTSVEIPDSVTSIGYGAFQDCPIESATIPAVACSYINSLSLKSVEITSGSIGYGAFSNCSNLTSVVIGDGVTSIGEDAFSNCYSLTSVVIGDSVTSIGYWAFYWCTSLTSVYYKGTASEWLKISIGSSNSSLTSASRYYYSEAQTTGFWHYNENGEIEFWK